MRDMARLSGEVSTMSMEIRGSDFDFSLSKAIYVEIFHGNLLEAPVRGPCEHGQYCRCHGQGYCPRVQAGVSDDVRAYEKASERERCIWARCMFLTSEG